MTLKSSKQKTNSSNFAPFSDCCCHIGTKLKYTCSNSEQTLVNKLRGQINHNIQILSD